MQIETNRSRIEHEATQFGAIRELMLDASTRGAWLTLAEIADSTEFGEASISAQLRHLRKPRFGHYRVEKRRRDLCANGAFDFGGADAANRCDTRAAVIEQVEARDLQKEFGPWEYRVFTGQLIKAQAANLRAMEGKQSFESGDVIDLLVEELTRSHNNAASGANASLENSAASDGAK